jgi:hypothetical protein
MTRLKHQRVIAAVDARLSAGHELSVAALAREAALSCKFIYAHPDLRAPIGDRAEQAATAGTATAVADVRVTIASVRADAANAKWQSIGCGAGTGLGAGAHDDARPADRQRDRPTGLRASRPAACPAGARVRHGCSKNLDAPTLGAVPTLIRGESPPADERDCRRGTPCSCSSVPRAAPRRTRDLAPLARTRPSDGL